jgi:hypothetical protein
MPPDLHSVTKLLLARMESHPEEFHDEYLMTQVRPSVREGRWSPVLRGIEAAGTLADKEAIERGLYPIRMGQVHEWMMDELCNGDERRRRIDEEDKYERTLMTQTWIGETK